MDIKLDIVSVKLIIDLFAKNVSRQHIKVAILNFYYIKDFEEEKILYESHNKIFVKEYLDSN